MDRDSLIGKGMTAEVLAWGEDTVVKLFYTMVPHGEIQKEVAIGEAVQEAGLPSPQIYGTVEKNGRTGVLFEWIRGESLLAHMFKKPWKMTTCAKDMARLHFKIHNSTSNNMPDGVQKFNNVFTTVSSLLSEDQERINGYIESMASKKKICHGDLHPDNIIVSLEGKHIAIDWTNAYAGDPLSDVARTYLILRSPHLPPGTSRAIRLVSGIMKKVISSAYIKEYMKLSGIAFEDILAWMLPMAVARMGEGNEGEDMWLQSMIETYL